MNKVSKINSVSNETENKSEPSLDQIFDKMKELFGDRIANFEHHPKIFLHQFNLARHIISRIF